MTQGRVLPRPKHRSPQQGAARNGSAERREYAPVKSLPSPRLQAPVDEAPGQSRSQSLLARQDPFLPVPHLEDRSQYVIRHTLIVIYRQANAPICINAGGLTPYRGQTSSVIWAWGLGGS